MIAIVDYGVGNLFSLSSSVQSLGAEVRVTGQADDLRAASHILLPGVGAFADAMAKLQATGLVPVLREEAQRKPLLGICLGMQMLFDGSDEFGPHEGLGLIPGWVRRLPAADAAGAPQRVPHIAWEPLLPGPGRADFAGTALQSVPDGGECYFIHSYAAEPADDAFRLADCLYGGRRVCAAAARGRVLGTQFHPEKSGAVGLGILHDFLALCSGCHCGGAESAS